MTRFRGENGAPKVKAAKYRDGRREISRSAEENGRARKSDDGAQNRSGADRLGEDEPRDGEKEDRREGHERGCDPERCLVDGDERKPDAKERPGGGAHEGEERGAGIVPIRPGSAVGGPRKERDRPDGGRGPEEPHEICGLRRDSLRKSQLRRQEPSA